MDAKIHWVCIQEVLVKFTGIKLCVFDLLHLMATWVISQVTWQGKFPYLICCLPANMLDFPLKQIIVQLTFSDWLSPPEACETYLLLRGWVFSDTQLSTASKCIKSFFPGAHPSHSRFIDCDRIRNVFTAYVKRKMWMPKKKKSMHFMQLGLFKSFLEMKNSQPEWTYIFQLRSLFSSLRSSALFSLVRDVVDSQSADMPLEAASFFKWWIIINLPGNKSPLQFLAGSLVCF